MQMDELWHWLRSMKYGMCFRRLSKKEDSSDLAERIWNYETGRGNRQKSGHTFRNFPARLSFLCWHAVIRKPVRDEEMHLSLQYRRQGDPLFPGGCLCLDFQEKGRKYINRMYLHSLFLIVSICTSADREKRGNIVGSGL